jgi:hypothetical protein
VKRIVFFGDLLRFHKTNPFHADRMAKTLHELFRAQIAAATGVAPELVLAREYGHLDRKKFYALAGLGEPSEDGWVRIASGDYDRSAAEYFAECFRGALVISHEAGSLLRVMDDAGIEYIDFRVAPIRFLDDILLCFKSNVPGVSERLLPYRFELDDIQFFVNKLRARYCVRMSIDDVGTKLNCAGLPPNSLLLCGQSGADLSLIRDGCMVTMRDCREKLEEVVSQYDHVYYKKHPAPGDRDITWEVVRGMRNVRRVDTNIYQMLCDDNLSGVAALSSGVLTEARFFEKQTHFLSHEYIALSGDANADGAEEYVMTRDEYYSPMFWRDIFSPCVETNSCRDFSFSTRTHLLRNLIDCWWGYEPEASSGSVLHVKYEGLQGLFRNAAEKLDPSHILRRNIDPTGVIRRRIMKVLLNS